METIFHIENMIRNIVFAVKFPQIFRPDWPAGDCFNWFVRIEEIEEQRMDCDRVQLRCESSNQNDGV